MNEFFEDDATLTISINLDDAPKRFRMNTFLFFFLVFLNEIFL